MSVAVVVFLLIYAFGQPVWLGTFLAGFIPVSVIALLRNTKKVNFVIPRSASWLALGFMLGWGFLILLSMLAAFLS